MENRTNQKICLIVSLFLLLLGPALAAADVIYVDAAAAGADNGSSWPNAYNYLQDALTDANSDFNVDQIRVAQGVYTPDTDSANPNGSGDREATFQLINGVAIYGGFPSGGAKLAQRNPDAYETILSSDLDGNDVDVNDPCDLLTEPTRAGNSYHVVTGSGTDATAVLDGFALTGGNANGSSWPNFAGGGMCNESGSPTLTNCTFSGNSASERGGGMFNYDGSDPTLTNCRFNGNSAGRGGGMYDWSANPTLKNCTFSGNSGVVWGGGGLFSYDSDSTLTDCTFSHNSAKRYGGGVLNAESNPRLTNCTFSGNSSEESGGGMHNSNSSPTLTDCTFSGNLASYAGGGMHNSNSSPTLTDDIFSGNSADWYGGGMYNSNSSPTLTNCTFSGNDANKGGGGMENIGESNPSMTNCTFSGNSANDWGGGMYNYSGSSPTLTDCTFSDNSADTFGGGMYNSMSSSPTLADCTFSGNWAEYGGGMQDLNSSPILTSCTFTNNSAGTSGGGLRSTWKNSRPRLTNCTFTENSAGVWGGGMCNTTSAGPMLVNCVFWDNQTGESGGGMYNRDSSPTLTNCAFSGNSARYGGAIDNYESSPALTNCAFSGNSACPKRWPGASGGAIHNWENSNATLTNCTFSGNDANNYGGGMYNSRSSATLANCIFWGNTAKKEGPQVSLYDSTLSISYCDLQGGQTQVYDYNSTVDWGIGNNDINPLFVRGPNDGGDGWGDDPCTPGVDEGANDDFGDLHLQAGSPCIDAADNTAVPPDACDLDGDGDTNEPIPWDCDTHPRFLDVSTVPDTGNGTPPIVDMGAYEYANMKIKKCKAAAGSRPGRDSFTCSAKMYATGAQIVGANQITVKIWASDDYLVYSETINVKPIKLKKRKYTYKHRLRKKRKRGFITYLRLDTKKHKFSLKAKKIDLTGLSCPLFVGIEVGDYAGLGKATERIVNGKKKRIPIRFMRGYADTLRAGKRRVKPRYLKIRGGIAVADWPNPANLKTQDVTITWGTQEFTIPAGSFYTRKKWNNKYRCKRAPILGGGIATATIDFKKCRFKLLIKRTKIDSRSGLVDFALKFDTFDQTVQLNL